MPSFWPFGREDSSAASFEKVLSQLSTKINTASARNDRLRQNSRRFKALWTLYGSFAYILVALILVLVTRIENWNAYEYTAIASGPPLIYGVRTGLDAYYNFRLSRSQEYLNDLTKQREESIEKLKKATKYNSTQQLLEKYGGMEKYGGSPGSAQGSGSATKGKRQSSPQPRKTGRKSDQGGFGTPPQQGPRTGFMPPPTANIPGRQPPPGPQVPNDGTAPPAGAPPPDALLPPNGAGEEFAPNAFSQPPPPPPILRQPSSSQYAAAEGPKWYDRILDVVLGEDETSTKNRIALICQECRLVNGQAPPGARTLEDVGRWRCSACQAWNGVESVEKKILKDAGLASPASAVSSVPVEDDMVDEEVGSDDIVEAADVAADGAEAEPPASSTRSKARQRKKD